MSDQQRKMQGELEMREQQVSELQRSRQELYEKLVTGEHNRGRQDESRLHQELERLQVRCCKVEGEEWGTAKGFGIRKHSKGQI